MREQKNVVGASPLIKDMLTVNPKSRANIERICAHWWVNEGYEESCLEISEELANQTPVRLDLLLSLAPPGPQLESEQLLIAGETNTDENRGAAESVMPSRSQSVGSVMDLNSAERRIKELIVDDANATPKRKLESITSSTDQVGVKDAGQRKDKIVKDRTFADVSVQQKPKESSDEMAVQTNSSEYVDPAAQGAVCAAIIEDAKKELKHKNETKTKTVETAEPVVQDKENIDTNVSPDKTVKSKIPGKVKVVKKKTTAKDKPVETKPESAEPVAKPVDRRNSRIFATAEKFQNIIAGNDPKPAAAVEKPPKKLITGISVDGFKKEFERKASLTSASSLPERNGAEEKGEEVKMKVEDGDKVRNAVSIISNALDKEGTRKSKSKPCMIGKPPVPFGASGRSSSGNIEKIAYPASRAIPVKTNVVTPLPPLNRLASFQTSSVKVSVPERVKDVSGEEAPETADKVSSAEITLKSATLPRRKTTKAEIKLEYPTPKPASMEFKTEMAHRVESGAPATTQRSEVVVPISSRPNNR